MCPHPKSNLVKRALLNGPPSPKGGGDESAQSYPEVDPSTLWYIHGKAYDLTSYMKTHPGGVEALTTCQGRDITSLFESYHAFNMSKPRQVLAKMKEVKLPPAVLAQYVNDVCEGNWWVKPSDGTPDPFWATLVTRCAKVMREQKIPRTMEWCRFLLSCMVIALQYCIYYFMYLSESSMLRYLAALGMALTNTFNTGTAHDAGHFAVSRVPWINTVMQILSSFLWSNCAVWQVMHPVHHMETNQEDNDPDMHHFVPWLRYSTSTPWRDRMNFQIYRAYCYLHWSLVTVGMLILHPARVFLIGRVTKTGPAIDIHRRHTWLRCVLVGHWVAFVAAMYAIPLYLGKPAAYGAFATYMHASGLIYGILSQISHFNQDCVDSAGKNTSWAQRQVETAANYGVQSRFWDYMSGSTNVQIEHHLFPQVCTANLVRLVPTVKATCEEFGVHYKEYPGMREILAATHEYMIKCTHHAKAQ